MPFVWEEFLTLAETLNRGTPSEAAHRTSISRAYYAAFHTAKIALESIGSGTGTGGDSHARVWNAYQRAALDNAKTVGIEGDRLRRSRHDADYKVVFARPDLAATAALARSRKIIQTVSSIPTSALPR